MGQDTGSFPPLNDSEDVKDQVITGVHCAKYEDYPDIGLFVVDTMKGHYAFLMTLSRANEMVQALREFIAGDSDPVIDDEEE